MQEPKITNHPTEIFGYPFVDLSSEAHDARQEQFCPFLDGECKKPRKSQPKIKIGVCSVGYKGKFLKKTSPIIICPHRLEEKIVYDTIEKLYFENRALKNKIQWVSEVSCGVAGSIDFVATKVGDEGIEDFICVEFQAAGTTGTPWEAVLDFQKTDGFIRKNYEYGINWANEFVKTMMQQVYKKGMVMESWGKKIVFVLQDVGLDYIISATDASDLHEVTDDDSIHFCTFKMIWNEDSSTWRLVFDKRMGTNTEGIRKILGGSTKDKFPTVDEFKENISSRLELHSETQLNFF